MTSQLILALIVVLFAVGFLVEIFALSRRIPKTNNATNRIITLPNNATFEQRVIAHVEAQTGCLAQLNPTSNLIEVIKFGKIVGVVRCCQDGWAVTPVLIAEVVKLRTWYHVDIAYIAMGGNISKEAKQLAAAEKIRLMRVGS